MELMHQMTPHLKRLRLSGILDTLEVRNQQAIDGRWTYVEFLARLLEDEVERRAQKQLGLRIRRAAINSAKTLETFSGIISSPPERGGSQRGAEAEARPRPVSMQARPRWMEAPWFCMWVIPIPSASNHPRASPLRLI